MSFVVKFLKYISRNQKPQKASTQRVTTKVTIPEIFENECLVLSYACCLEYFSSS